jgi:putative ABC transport system permease protein
MFKSYIKVALRNLLKFKVNSVINVIGLSIAIACLLLIYLFVTDELSYDSFHYDADSIYKVISVLTEDDGTVLAGALVEVPLGPAVKQEFPFVERAVRVLWTPDAVIRYGDVIYNEDLRCVDADFLEMFTFPLIAGDSAKALADPHSVVLTQAAAEKYFGSEPAIGKTLSITMSDQTADYTITGILGPFPRQSSVWFNVLIPIAGHPGYADRSVNWSSKSCDTYVQISDESKVKQLESESSRFLARYRHDSAEADSLEYPFYLGLQNIKDIHLNRDSRWELFGTKRLHRLYILSGIALLIFAMACINFTTLSVGRSSSRASEIGVRKSLGAQKSQLAVQFIGETLVLSFLALLFGIVLAELLLPTFNSLAGKDLSFGLTGIVSVCFSMIVLMILSGLLAGSYPAFVMARFDVVDSLKGKQIVGGKNVLTRILVSVQFVLSIFLLISTSVMTKQLAYLHDKDLGFDDEFLIAIPTYTGWGAEGDRVLELYKNELAGEQGIVSVSGVNYSFARGHNSIGWPCNGVNRTVQSFRVDVDFLGTIGAGIAEGRDFSRDFLGDFTGSIIVNESLVREFELESPVGQKLDGWGTMVMGDSIDPTIVGVVKDYHVASFRYPIKPVVLHLNPKMPLFNILVRISPVDAAGTLGALESVWREVNPGKPFDFRFVDEYLSGLTYMDRQLERTTRYSSGLAVTIACLGLFGLSALSVTRRTKEIGVRKVLGASIPSVLILVGREFLMLVILANLIAWPVAYLVMQSWLSEFAYRTPIGIDTFASAGLLALAIAIASICYQAAKAATANPIDAIRYE